MDDNLDEMYKRLSLTEREEAEVVVESGKLEGITLCGGKGLIMTLLTEKHFNREAFKMTMRRAWRPVKGVRFWDLNLVLTMVEFDYRCDKESVIWEGSWSFDKHLVLVQEVDGRKQAHQIKLTEASFCVRLHDLPLRARNEYVGTMIGKKIGRVEEVDVEKGELALGEFMRVRVVIDVTKLLVRGTKLSTGDGDSMWVRFSYERLPNFCYHCGYLGHGDKECGSRQNLPLAKGVEMLPYGIWIKATNYGGRLNEGRAWDRRDVPRKDHMPSDGI